MTTTTETRPLYEIAREINRDWSNKGKGVYFGAVPYLRALGALRDITDSYGSDSARSIVLYFLANANTWRGETARNVKKELKAMLAKR